MCDWWEVVAFALFVQYMPLVSCSCFQMENLWWSEKIFWSFLFSSFLVHFPFWTKMYGIICYWCFIFLHDVLLNREMLVVKLFYFSGVGSFQMSSCWQWSCFGSIFGKLYGERWKKEDFFASPWVADACCWYLLFCLFPFFLFLYYSIDFGY